MFGTRIHDSSKPSRNIVAYWLVLYNICFYYKLHVEKIKIKTKFTGVIWWLETRIASYTDPHIDTMQPQPTYLAQAPAPSPPQGATPAYHTQHKPKDHQPAGPLSKLKV